MDCACSLFGTLLHTLLCTVGSTWWWRKNSCCITWIVDWWLLLTVPSPAAVDFSHFFFFCSRSVSMHGMLKFKFTGFQLVESGFWFVLRASLYLSRVSCAYYFINFELTSSYSAIAVACKWCSLHKQNKKQTIRVHVDERCVVCRQMLNALQPYLICIKRMSQLADGRLALVR